MHQAPRTAADPRELRGRGGNAGAAQARGAAAGPAGGPSLAGVPVPAPPGVPSRPRSCPRSSRAGVPVPARRESRPKPSAVPGPASAGSRPGPSPALCSARWRPRSRDGQRWPMAAAPLALRATQDGGAGPAVAAVSARLRARYSSPAARSVPSLTPMCWASPHGRRRVSLRDLSRASGGKGMPAPGGTRSLRCRGSVNKTRWQPALSEEKKISRGHQSRTLEICTWAPCPSKRWVPNLGTVRGWSHPGLESVGKGAVGLC